MPPTADPHEFSVDASSSSHYVPRQPWVPPVPASGQPEGHREPEENIPPQIRGIAGTGRAQGPHHPDVGYQGVMVDYRPQPFTNPAYVFPDGRHVQGIPIQGQQSAPVALNQDLVGYHPQNVGHGPPQAAFLQPIIHPGQPRAAENLRQLANRYLDHPGARLRAVSTEEGTTGGFIVAIILEVPNVP